MLRTDDALSHRVIQTTRMPDRYHPIADLDGIRIPKGHMRQDFLCLDHDDGQIGLGIRPHQPGGIPVPIRQQDRNTCNFSRLRMCPAKFTVRDGEIVFFSLSKTMGCVSVRQTPCWTPAYGYATQEYKWSSGRKFNDP
jgi:hypothetical protein